MKSLAIMIEWNEEAKAVRARATVSGALARLPQKDVIAEFSRQVADPIYGANNEAIANVVTRAMDNLRDQLNDYAAAEQTLDQARELLGLPPEPMFWIACARDGDGQLFWFQSKEDSDHWLDTDPLGTTSYLIEGYVTPGTPQWVPPVAMPMRWVGHLNTDMLSQRFWFTSEELAHQWLNAQGVLNAVINFAQVVPGTPEWVPPVVAPTHWVGYAVADQNTQVFWFASEELAQQWLNAQGELEAVITIGQVAPGTPEWTGPAIPGQGFSAWMVLQDIDLMTRHAVYYFPSQGEAVDYANALAQDIVDGPVDEQVVFGVVPAGVIEYPTDDGPVAWMARESDDSQHLWFENKALAVDWLRLQMEVSLVMDFHLYFGRVHAGTELWVTSGENYV